MNVPKLRFKDDDGREFPEWQEKQLGNIASFSKGKGISKADIDVNGATYCIRYGELYTDYGETIRTVKSKTNIAVENLVLSEVNDVIIPASGETQIDIATASCVQEAGVALGGDLNIIKSQENGVFLSYYLNSQKKLDIAKLAQGNSVVHLYSSQLKLLDLNLPSKSEQTKIANFLTAVDEKITQLIQKSDLLAQYKKGVMQKIFSQELRFKDNDGREYSEWGEVVLEDILDYEQPTKYLVTSTDYDDSYETPVLTAGKTFILGYTDETTGVFQQNLPVIIFDDFTTAFKYVNFPFKAKSSAMKILKIKDTTNSIKYVYEAMQLIDFPSGDEHKRYWISEYSKISIPLPSSGEQTKIANFLTAIDDKITQTQAELDAVKQYKQGLLQQMFI